MLRCGLRCQERRSCHIWVSSVYFFLQNLTAASACRYAINSNMMAAETRSLIQTPIFCTTFLPSPNSFYLPTGIKLSHAHQKLPTQLNLFFPLTSTCACLPRTMHNWVGRVSPSSALLFPPTLTSPTSSPFGHSPD